MDRKTEQKATKRTKRRPMRQCRECGKREPVGMKTWAAPELCMDCLHVLLALSHAECVCLWRAMDLFRWKDRAAGRLAKLLGPYARD